TYLKKVGLLENSERGVWVLTGEGERTKEIEPDHVVSTVQALARSERARRKARTPGKISTTKTKVDKSEPRSLSPHLPTYKDVHDFLHITDGIPYNHYRLLLNSIRDEVGTPQDPTDWSNP